MILGGDAAGVTADGREVIVHGVVDGPDGLGEEVSPYVPSTLFSEHFPGTHAQRLAAPTRNLITKPAELTFEEAACLPVAWLTAYRMLFTRGAFRPGSTVLVQGAGGGVATAAIQLGRAAGLRMWVTSRSEEKRARALALGADAAFETGARLPERVDGVLETVGEATWTHSVRSVRNLGTIVVSGGTSGRTAPLELPHLFFRQLNVVGSTMGTRQELRDLVAMLVTTGVRPAIDAHLPAGRRAPGLRAPRRRRRLRQARPHDVARVACLFCGIAAGEVAADVVLDEPDVLGVPRHPARSSRATRWWFHGRTATRWPTSTATSSPW